MDEKYQIFKIAQYPIYVMYEKVGPNQLIRNSVQSFSNELAVYNLYFNPNNTESWYRKQCGNNESVFHESTNNFEDWTYKECDNGDRTNVYQILIKPESLHDKTSFSNNGTVYIDYYNYLKNDYKPNKYMFTGTCNKDRDYLAANKIYTTGALIGGYLSENFPIPSSIGYNTDYTCSLIPLGEYYNFDKEKNINNTTDYDYFTSESMSINSPNFDFDGKNPLKNLVIDSNKLKGTFYNIQPTYKIFDESENKNIDYIITSSNYDGTAITYDNLHNYYIYNDINSTFSNVNETTVKQYIGSDNYFNTTYGDDILFQNMSNGFKNKFDNYIYSNGSNLLQISCNEGDFITGFKKVFNSNDNNIIITPHCIHYDIQSTELDLSQKCPADEDWPETNILTNKELQCPENHIGKITRFCTSNKTWLDPVNTCSKITCSKTGDWPETEVGKEVSIDCSNKSGIITKKCINENGYGKWKDIKSTCKPDSDNKTLITIFIIIAVLIVVIFIFIFIMKSSRQKHERDLNFLNNVVKRSSK